MNGTGTVDVIPPEIAGTLAGLFQERVRRTPDATAYRCHDADSGEWRELSWSTLGGWVNSWQAVLAQESLAPGDRVAVMARNCPAWAVFDQAALGLGLAVVPLHLEDSSENLAHILSDCGARVILIEGPDQWQRLQPVWPRLPQLQRVFSLKPVDDLRVEQLQLTDAAPAQLQAPVGAPDDLATIIYTSGTTGRPKGVMLSHRNILWNAYSGMHSITIHREDLFLSFLPLAHAFERTVGYYLPMMAGATVAYARSIAQLAEDLRALRPTVIISVPRIYERVHNRIHEQLASKPPLAGKLFHLAVETGWQRFEQAQGRRSLSAPAVLLWPLLQHLVARKILDNLGGRVRIAICGGAPLSFPVARTFVGLGLPLLQGYGMTEASPVLCVNTLTSNDPESVGPPLKDVELRLGEQDELLARGPGVMLGYWNQPEATRQIIDEDGWLHTGDQARLAAGAAYITGRLKEIIVLSNGKKVPPEDVEMAIRTDPLFEQVMLVGDNHPYLTALVVLNSTQAEALERNASASEPSSAQRQSAILARIGKTLEAFPGHARVRRVAVVPEPWSVENGCMTPTLKLRRGHVLKRHAELVKQLYSGHESLEPAVASGVQPEATGLA